MKKQILSSLIISFIAVLTIYVYDGMTDDSADGSENIVNAIPALCIYLTLFFIISLGIAQICTLLKSRFFKTK